MFSKTGDTVVSGNLDIISSNTEINSDDINIKNNIIILNSKETSNKVSNNVAGLEINRGTSLPYQILYDERDSELKSGLSNNLKPISSEEYTTTNVTNAKTDLNTQIYKNDFMNELPKIGYYQEDTVEVLSKYNMNYQVNSTSHHITSENNGQEVLYTTANDGSLDANVDMYKAIRNGNTNFTFYNTPIRPKCLENKSITSILYVDNNHMICSGKDFSNTLIDTKYTSQDSSWEIIYDSITTQITKDGYTLYNCYITKDGKFLISGFIINSPSNKQTSHFAIKIIRLSDLSLLQEFTFDNIFNYYRCNNGMTYSKAINDITDALDPKADTIPINWWISPGFLFDEENNIVSINMQQIRYYAFFNNTFSYQDHFNAHFPLCWKVDKTFWLGESKNITSLITSKFYPSDNMNTNYNNIFSKYSYDHINKYAYRISKIRDNKIVQVICFDFKKMTQGVNQEHYGDNNNAIVYNSQSLPLSPDSSYWGKKMNKIPFFNNTMFIHGESKAYGDKVIKINKFKWKNKDLRIIEPMPGQYNIDSDNKISKAISAVFNSNNKVTYRQKDNSVTYGYGQYSNNKIISYSMNIQEDYSYSWQQIDSIDWSFNANMMKDPDYTNISILSVVPNPIKNEYFLILRYNNTELNLPHTYKIFFGLLDKNKIFHSFGTSFIDKFDSGLKSTNDTAHNNLPNQTSITIYHIIYDAVNDWYIFGHNWYRQQSYATNYSMIKFINNNTDIEMHSINPKNSITYDFATIINNNFKITYSGPTLGYIAATTYNNNSWVFNNKGVVTQKKILADDIQDNGIAYSDNDFLFNQKGYKYSWFLQSSQGLICYIPNIPIFLGGYFSVLNEVLSVDLKPNTNNYIYLERDLNTNQLKAYASTTKDIEEGSKQFSRILLARILTNEANPIETEYYRINTGYNDYTFYHKITIKQTPNQTIHVYTTENGQRVDHTTSFFVKINSNIQYNIEIKPDLWYVAGTLQNISSSGIINQNIIVSATTANLISTNYSYDFKIEYATSTNTNDTYAKIKYPLYCFGNNISSTWPSGQNYSGSLTPIDNIAINTVYDSAIQYQHTKPLPDEIKSVFIKLVCKDGEHYLGHFTRNEFDQYGDIYHSKILGTKDNFDLFKRLYDSQEVFTCVVGVET